MASISFKGWRIAIFNPFRKRGMDERFIGFNAYKDWHHCMEFDIRWSVRKYPHLTICHAYTTKTEWVEKFWMFRSKSYRSNRGGFSFYEKSVHRQGIDEGRCGCG